MLKDKTLTYVSLFSCAGVGCYGFKQAGFECVATNELIERRIKVQKINEKCKFDTGYICDDITLDQTKDKIYKEIDFDGKDLCVRENELYKKNFLLEEFAGDTFFELGCVNDINVKELYDFMIKNNSRILFAKIEDLEIIILGGVKFFIESEFCYPLCLSNIEIL